MYDRKIDQLKEAPQAVWIRGVSTDDVIGVTKRDREDNALIIIGELNGNGFSDWINGSFASVEDQQMFVDTTQL